MKQFYRMTVTVIVFIISIYIFGSHISEKDNGIYDAMNKGIRMATGDVIGILNSDDFFTANTILQQVAEAFVANKDVDAVYGDVHFVNPENLGKCVRYYSSKVFKSSS